MIEELLTNKISNLVNIYRYSGQPLNRAETDSDHVWLMNSMALVIVPKLNSLYESDSDKLDIKDIVYRVTVHDIDECVTFDIPRNFKYYDDELLTNIRRVTDSILSQSLPKSLVSDINNAKDDSKAGFLVRALDVFQVIFKYYAELNNTGNHSIIQYINLSVDVLKDLRNYLSTSNYDNIYKQFMGDLINEFIDFSYKKFAI